MAAARVAPTRRNMFRMFTACLSICYPGIPCQILLEEPKYLSCCTTKTAPLVALNFVTRLQIFGQQDFRNLDTVEGGAFSDVIGYNPQGEALGV